MAARRLIAILVALLLVSSFAAALAPQRQTDETSTTTSSEPEATGAEEAGPEGRLLRRSVDAKPGTTRVIPARPGDQLELTVRVSRPTEVRIPGLSQEAFAEPGDPALFDLLLREVGTYAVTVGDGEAVARLQISG